MARQHNFSAGPAVLPVSVLEQLQGAILEFGDTGMGLMELSHRSRQFEAVVAAAQERLRRLLVIPADYTILFLQGGASLQFYMHALNLLAPGEPADYLITGAWSKKALKEAGRCGDARSIWQPGSGVYDHIPAPDQYQAREEAVFVHYTSNNTIFGTQWKYLPAVDKPLVGDLSSDICSRPVDVSRHALLYAGAQKNLGPSGVTAVVLSPWAMERSKTAGQMRPGGLPAMLDYAVHAADNSLYNTPNTFGIFALERVLAWVEDQGGTAAMEQQTAEKAGRLYAELDRTEFWRPFARANSRSNMNINWTTPTPELDAKFVSESDKAGLKALKGHRSVGGLRASLYNACPSESVDALISFMRDFEARYG